MEPTSKKDLAISFLSMLASIPREELQKMIDQLVGDELAAVLFGYAKQIVESEPEKILENSSSLLILGYLIRVHEEGGLPGDELPA